ncbi:C-C chemokine receptor type 7 [Pezoporus wallicus]|uniref:C-C chemokine receptor type 7 n=1 Tax=Pezoporus wallicus TaxID=35540 RepID=UPI00254D0E80|nr:C-C chemokine receptor type 7 [Pezoporus wallicus]XP_061333675.1 C-C chemokine receptor type 7 [Pezoporus flaviventris]
MEGGKPLKVALVLSLPLFFQVCAGNNVTDYYDSNTTIDYNEFEVLCEKDDVRNFRAAFLPAMYALICFTGLLGNGLVVLTYIYFKRLKTMTDIYLLNLALADILFLLTLPFWATTVAKHWLFGKFACKAVYCICRMSFFSGMLLLLSISIDRYFAIVQAASAHRFRPQMIFISKVTCTLIWLLAFILSIPELVHSGVKNVDNNPHCSIIAHDLQTFNAGIKVSQMVFGFLFPLLVMSACYLIIIKTLLQARNFEKNKAIKVIIAVVIVFVIFQLPYNGVMLAKTISAFNHTSSCEESKQLDVADDVTYTLACFRCCLNPFLYAFIGVKFRNDLFKLLKELGCLSQQRLLQLSTCRESKRFSYAMETETTTTFSP